MLVKITVKNTRSIKLAEVSFKKSGIGYRTEYLFDEKFVNPITIYGDNGSGKTLFLESLKYLTVLMNYSEKELRESAIMPDLLNFFSDKKDRTFEIPVLTYEFITKTGLNFTYSIACVSNTISKEKLIVDDITILKRNKSTFILKGADTKEQIGSSYSAVRKIGIEEYSKKEKIKNIVKECFDCMKKVIYIDSEENVFGNRFGSITPTEVMLNYQKLSSLVSDYSSLPSFKYITDKKESSDGKKTIFLDFGGGVKMPLALASDGIVRENHLLSAMMVASEDADSVVVIDEINRSIHPLNLKGIMDEFVKKNIQMIFTCHDTSVMKYLRPDQIYFTYLKRNMETILRRLNEIHPNIREINNIESMYLKGVFNEELQRSDS